MDAPKRQLTLLMRRKRDAVDAYARAARMHEATAKRQQASGQPGRAAVARARADNARQLLHLAADELHEIRELYNQQRS